MIDKKNSFTSADSIPVKLFKDFELFNAVAHGYIPPIHAQFIPTNKCNMNCPFCSCDNEDRTKEMDLDNAILIIKELARLGCKAVTITGGGEPLLHPDIETIIKTFDYYGIKIGLVSNGLLLDKIDPKILDKITWCRISNGDFRTFNDKYKEKLDSVVKSAPNVDWAFSHVVSEKPNLEEIKKIIEFANEHNFTHIRLVADLFQPEIIQMELIQTWLEGNNVDISKVIFQPRKEPTRGQDCYIGYLKPLISADYKVYNCCGVQYALANVTKKLPDELCMGSAFELESIMKRSSEGEKNGNLCVKCYYKNYNDILKAMITETKHKEFL